MSKKTIIVIIFAVLILAALGVLRFLTPEDTWLCQNNQWVKHGQPANPAPTSGCGEVNQPLVGNDRDEHGCIGSAGYSWCEAKKECLRVFEQDCLSAEKITAALAEKYHKPVTDVFVKIDKENTQYARGEVSFAPAGGEGGMFLAVKTGDNWQLVYDGNGSIDCNKIKQTYQFPADMLTGFCD
ncbi:MAG: hypothetical protein NTZ18_02900 [Candidatus Komeilibacteria bacterium]|nr:hypothetical protein [Candidatus Komeilibacteria bacterium]